MRKWTRNIRMNLRFTEEEKDFLEQRRIDAGIDGMSDFFLKCAGEMPIVNIDTRPFYSVANELNRIGTNINQIAKIANTSRSIYKDDIAELQETMKELSEIVHKCMGVFVDAREGKLLGLRENVADNL